jgi:hypothetical protein
MEDMLGAWTFIPMSFTRLTIGWLRASPGAYPVGPFRSVTNLVGGPRTAIPLAHRGKSLADDLD